MQNTPDVIAEFIVEGVPAPQGSKQIRHNRDRSKAWLTESSQKLKPWREAVSEAAREAMTVRAYGGNSIQRVDAPYGDAVHASLTFVFPRPKSVSVAKRPHHTVKPDIDKLERAILDALTGTVLTDDAVVVTLQAHKRYQHAAAANIENFDKPGVIVRVTRHVG